MSEMCKTCKHQGTFYQQEPCYTCTTIHEDNRHYERRGEPPKITTDEQLQALCAEWQERIGLRDWTIVARVKRLYDMGRMDGIGHCSWTLPRREAFIRVLDQSDYDGDSITPYDIEQTLVHELLHCHFAPYDAQTGTLEQTMQEQTIEALSNALVKLKRGEA